MQEKRPHSLEDSFLRTLHQGFNYFNEVEFPISNKIRNRQRMYTTHTHNTTFQETVMTKNIRKTLHDNKYKFKTLKCQMESVRDYEFNDYIKKSNRYQDLLDINDNKKKRLPTLNTKVGEVVKKSTSETVSRNIFFQMKCTKYKLESWKPQSREGHTTIVYKNMAIIIGGHCSFPFSTMQTYSF